jgi:hypothetical protein
MLGKARITAIAAATVLASPAFAASPFAQPAQGEQIDAQRIIREVVINGGLIESDSDWIDGGGALDRARRQPY